VIRHDFALSRVHALQAREGAAVNPLCKTLFLGDEGRAARCFVLLHGFTNCPRQFAQLAERLHRGGDAVLVPRYPYHGLNDRLTKEPSRLTTEDLIRFANDVTDIGQGLGSDVVVAGLSLGGLLAMWLGQHRADVARAVAVSPVFGLRRVPTRLVRLAASRLPDRYLWWDQKAKADLPPPYGYPRFSTRAYSALLGVAGLIEEASRKQRPKAGSMGVLLNANEPAIDNRATLAVVERWRKRGAKVDVRELQRELGLPHDLIDPGNPEGNVEIVYPVVLDLLNG
jgi:pimeloyl-ACP methyl ester carboxylesterase